MSDSEGAPPYINQHGTSYVSFQELSNILLAAQHHMNFLGCPSIADSDQAAVEYFVSSRSGIMNYYIRTSIKNNSVKFMVELDKKLQEEAELKEKMIAARDKIIKGMD